MKKFEILQELPEFDTETQNEQMVLENGAHRLDQHTNFQFVKKKKKCSICEAQ